MQNNIYSMIGLCMKAGKLAFGSDMCEEKIKCNKVRLLIIVEDASDNTKQKFNELCGNRVQYKEFGTIDDLSHAIGKENKAIVGIMDEGFSKKINELIEDSMKGAND